MDNTFNQALFTSKDKVKAFNYLFHDSDSEYIYPQDGTVYGCYTSSDEMTNSMILRANMKKVQIFVTEELVPFISAVLSLKGQDHEYFIFNPTIISNSFNPFKKGEIQKIYHYIVGELYNMPNLWICFEQIHIKGLEQFIKLKYKDYIFEKGSKLYVRLLPQEDFSFVYEFIDDLFYYC